jgi:predicted nucleic acid-binding protein
MSSFIDTNIIIYANDARSVDKQSQAIDLVSRLMRDDTGVISTQVLQEYAHVALNKLDQRQDVVIRQLFLLESFTVIGQSPELIRRAIEIRSAYCINFWDACIISAAEKADCDTIYSEDLNAGQFYSGIIVRNPFTV